MLLKYIRSSFLFLCLLIANNLYAQNSVLVNFGSNSCTSGIPGFSLIKNPLSATPEVLADCNLSAQLPDYFAVLIAYNPLDNKIYLANTRSNSRIWVLDMGLPVSIACPATIPVLPTFSYNYVSNNFEFDNNGNLWSLSTDDSIRITGRCNIDKFDVNTGTIISSKILQFPAGNFPTRITSGDLTILPNGRMFAVLGDTTCRLYEITNYSTAGGVAQGIFLTTVPKDCYGISYLNGLLELAGTNLNAFNSCYYYDYNIATNTLGTEKVFQNGQTPIDNASITAATGCTKRLLSAAKINANTADLVYEVYVENLGNVILNNINVTDDLSVPYGAANVSNVHASFVPGSNAANLTLNPAYNGTTVTSILNPGQNLPNKVLANRNYFFKLQVTCRVTNLNTTTTYLNSAIAKANVGASSVLSTVPVSDSSNNGDTTVLDPNKNGNAGDVGENVPTPFNFAALPVKFINASATLLDQKTALVKWQVAIPMENAAAFEVEYSIDGTNWKKAGGLMIDNQNKANWQFTHTGIPTGNLYYRIKQIDKDGSFTYSRIIVLKNKTGNSYVIYPNPANNFIAVSAGYDAVNKAALQLFDATGRLLVNKPVTAANEELNTSLYSNGTYMLRIVNEEEVMTYKVIIRH